MSSNPQTPNKGQQNQGNPGQQKPGQQQGGGQQKPGQQQQGKPDQQDPRRQQGGQQDRRRAERVETHSNRFELGTPPRGGVLVYGACPRAGVKVNKGFQLKEQFDQR